MEQVEGLRWAALERESEWQQLRFVKQPLGQLDPYWLLISA